MSPILLLATNFCIFLLAQCHSEGLYLDDVLQADKEVAALYFNRQACIFFYARCCYIFNVVSVLAAKSLFEKLYLKMSVSYSRCKQTFYKLYKG